ncbi:helix-turn-helix domain-containing protein [Devosia sp. Root685]|uniref:helix-turn-helix domain-containing protein n=1 Tax=Devosia sp. Root685 TaxID=1736587 RepID=UPI000A894938|nr:helix-turn-helix transcriptional regulator [Devosia sp. Root685]
MAVTAFATPPEMTGAMLIAGNVVRLRRIRNLSLETFATRLGWSLAEVRALETSDKFNLALDDIDNLAQALDVEPAALFV